MPACMLCGVPGVATTLPSLFEHPPNGTCLVRLFYADGLCADNKYELDGGVVYDLDPDPALETANHAGAGSVSTGGDVIRLDGVDDAWVNAEVALRDVFAGYGVPFLGGTSGERGWSSISTYAKCPYLWSKSTMKRAGTSGSAKAGSQGISEGSLIHALLAVHYQKLIDPAYPVDPITLHAQLTAARVHPEWLETAWRVFQAYLRYYANDVIEPIAVEHLVTDPRSGRTCRIDLIFRVSSSNGVFVPGTYLCDHKSAKAFYAHTMEWRNDGTILTQLDLWDACHLGKRFGELRGAVVNLLGKQLEPKFERIIVPPVARVLRDHRRHMPIWIAKMEMDRALGVFPRNRANCISQYGKCELFDHCAGDVE